MNSDEAAAVPEIQQVLPKYLQIAGHIRDQIVRGDLLPGAEVPSERELAASWRVARPTAARALETLRVQGLVSSVQGSGTYVRDPSAAPRARERYERAGERVGHVRAWARRWSSWRPSLSPRRITWRRRCS